MKHWLLWLLSLSCLLMVFRACSGLVEIEQKSDVNATAYALGDTLDTPAGAHTSIPGWVTQGKQVSNRVRV